MHETLPSIDLQVSVDPQAPATLDDAVTFETGASRAQVADPALYAYNHHGPGFAPLDPGALTSLVQDIVQGRPLPLRFVARTIEVDTLVAMAVFLRRNLVLSPRLLGFVAEVDTAHRLGTPFLAHLDTRVCQLLQHLAAMFPPKLGRAEMGQRLQSAIGWVEDYVTNNTLPAMRRWPQDITLLEHGTSGFGVFETPHPPLYGWIEVFRRGYLRGAVIGPRREVWVSRKSAYVPFDLDQGAFLLTELEGRIWVHEGDWLKSPHGGTTLTLPQLLSVLVRI